MPTLLLLLLAAEVRVLPESMELTHPREPRSVLVLGKQDGYDLDLLDKAALKVEDPKVAVVENGWVRPVADGDTRLTVSVEGKSFTIAVKVRLPKAAPPMSFRHEVMPVLTQAGCNAGACHGYSLGKNGFKLSLRGEAPEEDFGSIVRDLAGRRVDFISPAESLLLRKARGDAPHEGGTRFTRGSLADRILTEWIRQGAPSDLKDERRVARVRMLPEALTLRPGQSHRVQLLADYADGSRRDATRLGVFAANNERFAFADVGRVKAGEAGETAIVGRFERLFAATGATVLAEEKGFVPARIPTDPIDKAVVEKLNRLRIKPAPLADDETFLRRVFLDLIGVQPTPDEVRSFLAERGARKREKAVDALFERPEFVDHWSLKWGDLLQNSRNVASPQAVWLFREHIRSAVAENLPADRFVKRLLTAKGGPTDDPASVYLAISKDANDTAERVTQVFCGVRMLCAKCHSHPMENWSQAEYYGLSGFFTQVSARADPRQRNAANAKVVRLNLDAGPAVHPRTGRAVPPKYLGGEEPKLAAGSDRRAAYAEWLVSPRNPWFARGLANRVWSWFFHRGIIEPVDDVRSTNPPINPALLDALTRELVEGKFDLRHLMRRIVLSETYQRSGEGTEELNFSRAVPRRVPAEALLDSLVQATGVPEGLPNGFRAAQLPDGNVENEFLRLFGKPQRMDACECERDNGSNLLQALHFLNGKSILGRVRNPGARPAQLLARKLSDEQLLAESYLWALSRHPRGKEVGIGLAHLRSYGEKRDEALQDLFWALLNSKDFLLSR
ncbi:MAG: DUF1549 and DUF1553 domain-containing protein [Gemmataceae bacterium]|nr:DUF1549 and DUF1553 domain-containing protein [Gemmataceae bacterium]